MLLIFCTFTKLFNLDIDTNTPTPSPFGQDNVCVYALHLLCRFLCLFSFSCCYCFCVCVCVCFSKCHDFVCQHLTAKRNRKARKEKKTGGCTLRLTKSTKTKTTTALLITCVNSNKNNNVYNKHPSVMRDYEE